MTRDDYERYITAFNDGDVERYSGYYARDVVLELGKRSIAGSQGIREFYAAVRSKVREVLVVRQFIGDETGVAAELDTSFEAIVDWPDFIVRPIKAGEIIRLVSFVMYRIKDGKFIHIRAARFGEPR